MVAVDVVIPTWNRCDLLRDCLGSLDAQTQGHTVYVVDNGSSDGTAEMLRREFPAVCLVELPENLGFGRAVNRGVAAGTAEFVVLLNNDTLAPPGFVAAIVAPLVAMPALASVAGVMVHPDGSTIDAAGVFIDTTLAGYSYLHGQPLVTAGEAAPPLGPCGGAAAYRREAFETLGGFDPEIFAYSEDVDLALRAQARGFGCAVAADAVVTHLGGATLGVRSQAQQQHAGWARGYLLARYRLGIIAILVEALVSLLDALRSRRFTPVLSRWQGYRRGRQLPARPWSPTLAAVSLTAGLRLRAGA